RRVTISPSPKNDSARRSKCVSVSGKSIIRPSIRLILLCLPKNRVGDFETQLGGTATEAFEPDGALVEPVQRGLPGEAGAAVCLDGGVAGRGSPLGGRGLCLSV